MAQVLLDGTEQDRIEEQVARFDPATHPAFAPLLDTVGEDLEVVRAYTAELIRMHLGLGLLARAVGGAAVKAGWSDARGVKELISVARGDALTDGPASQAYSDMAQRRNFRTDDITDGALRAPGRRGSRVLPDVTPPPKGSGGPGDGVTSISGMRLGFGPAWSSKTLRRGLK